MDARYLKWIAGSTALVGLSVAQPYRPLLFVGSSMEPTYSSGSVAVMRRFDGRLERGDVVSLQVDGKTIVKRIAWLPGDKVPQLLIGSEWLDATDFNLRGKRRFSNMFYRERVVPPGKVYIRGDNPVISVDSRQLGCLPISSIKGVLLRPRPQQNANLLVMR